MDISDTEISFDENGICNHCNDYEERKILYKIKSNGSVKDLIDRIKSNSLRKKYDCIVGVSGGVDSSYVALIAKKYDLRVLLVHLDNGWNSELAIHNIQKIVDYTGFDLHTIVIDWKEFKDIQKSFFHADVVDLELVSDHAIFASVYEISKKYGVRYILNGENFETEAIMPKSWNWSKSDATNIKDIHRIYGSGIKPKTFPFMSTLKKVYFKFIYRIESIQILNLIEYNKEKAISLLESEIGWVNYGGKHFESIFTRFYQGLILPKKFNIDKRKAHLSTLINSGQITKDEAINSLNSISYSEELQKEDFDYVCKKLGFEKSELENYLNRPSKSHSMYKNEEWVYKFLLRIRSLFS